MNPFDEENSVPKYWLSCMIIDNDAICKQIRGEQKALYISEQSKSCPTEILESIASINAEGRHVWKPMYMQPVYRMNGFVIEKVMEAQGQMIISVVELLENKVSAYMSVWIFFTEDYVCRVTTE